MRYKIIIIIILSLFLFYNFYMILKISQYIFDEPNYDLCNNTKKYKTVIFDDILDNVETGDIILFSSYSYIPIFRIFGHNTFSHIGMIIKLNNQIFSLEMTDYYRLNNIDYYNKCLFPLYDRINTYTGNVFICKLKNKLNTYQIDKLNELVKNDSKFLSPIELFLYMSHNINYKNKYTCGSYIYFILQELNVISNLKINNIDINPFLINMCHQNIIYNYPVELLCNSSKIKKLTNKSISYP